MRAGGATDPGDSRAVLGARARSGGRGPRVLAERIR